MTQKTIIKKYLESLGGWVREFEIHRIDTPFGFIGPRGERDIREMLADRILEGAFDGRFRIVRIKPEPKPESNYRPEVLRQRMIEKIQKQLL